MKKLYLAAACIAAFFAAPSEVHAGDDDSNAFGLRFSGEADYRIMSGLHVNASEEIRLLGGSGGFDRSYTQVGMTYRICDYLKAGLSYTAIAVNRTDETMTSTGEIMTEQSIEWRHRVSGDIIGQVKAGQWKFSLRERIQGTYKMRDLNNYQQPQMAWVLRSRLKVAYEFRSVPLEPYVYFEPRLLLNGSKWSPEGNGPDFANATFLGHKDVYVDRYRGAAGLEWRLNMRNYIDFYCFFDHLYDKEIDARREGSNKGPGLKMPVTGITTNCISIGIGYKYSF